MPLSDCQQRSKLQCRVAVSPLLKQDSIPLNSPLPGEDMHKPEFISRDQFCGSHSNTQGKAGLEGASATVTGHTGRTSISQPGATNVHTLG